MPTTGELGLLAELVGPSGAARLVKRFGLVRGVALAGDEDLRRAGMSSKRVRTLRAAFELGLRANAVAPVGTRFGSGADVARYFSSALALREVEELHVLALDARHRVRHELMVARGTLTGVDCHPRDVFRALIRVGAAAAIFCHNHPSGDPTPSAQDRKLTARLRQVGELCGIAVLDHVIVASGGLYVSLAKRGWT